MTTLLVLTAGQTDVQLVVDGVRRELSRDRCGELHDALAQRELTIVDAPEKKEPPPLDTLPEGKLSVCTPKLDAVLRFFEPVLPAAAIVFETRRTLKGDPRFAGAVLEQRLSEREIGVRRHTFLEGDQRLEDASNDVDAVVRRSIVEGLSGVIATAVEETRPERIVVATTGGLVAANDVIEELVRMHAVGRGQVTSLEVPDGAFTAQHDRAVEEKFHPAAGYRARWHALSLIENGNLLAAWGACSHLEGAPGQEWIRVIEWLSRFASSLPLPADCRLSVLSHPRMTVRAALRVELALRAGDVPRAVHSTVAFFEGALWDKLLETTSKHASKRQFAFKTAPPANLVRERDPAKQEAMCKAKQDVDRKRPFIFKESGDGSDWFFIDDSAICAIQIAKHYLKLDALMKFGQAIGSDVRALRNDVAHNEPTPELMDDARRRMQAMALWSTSDTFLSQPLVQAVLHELGVCEPETLLVKLLAEVRQRLVPPGRSMTER